MNKRIIFSGSGGQGIQVASRILCQAFVEENKNISLIPSYGAEMRGGKTTCSVVVSDEAISSPLFDIADYILALSEPAIESYKNSLAEGGMLVADNTLSDIPKNAVNICAAEIADKELGSMRIMNMVALGAFIKATGLLKPESAVKAIEDIMGKKNKEMCEDNIAALKKGYEKGTLS
jgi:2-oxoglutarate ferredoxin oxidoreductase subunit gamma